MDDKCCRVPCQGMPQRCQFSDSCKHSWYSNCRVTHVSCATHRMGHVFRINFLPKVYRVHTFSGLVVKIFFSGMDTHDLQELPHFFLLWMQCCRFISSILLSGFSTASWLRMINVAISDTFSPYMVSGILSETTTDTYSTINTNVAICN